MLALAECPNTVVKLGGLAMQVGGFDFHLRDEPPGSAEMAEAWRPYVETCIEAFGAARCMFESNFPVDKGMCAYPVLWNAFKRLAAGASRGREGGAVPRHRDPRLPPGPPAARDRARPSRLTRAASPQKSGRMLARRITSSHFAFSRAMRASPSAGEEPM